MAMQQDVVPDVITYNALISACEKGEQPEQALKIFGEMKQRGPPFPPRPGLPGILPGRAWGALVPGPPFTGLPPRLLPWPHFFPPLASLASLCLPPGPPRAPLGLPKPSPRPPQDRPRQRVESDAQIVAVFVSFFVVFFVIFDTKIQHRKATETSEKVPRRKKATSTKHRKNWCENNISIKPTQQQKKRQATKKAQKTLPK